MMIVNFWRAFTLFWQLFVGLSVLGIFAVTLLWTGTDWLSVTMVAFCVAGVVAGVVEGVRSARESA